MTGTTTIVPRSWRMRQWPNDPTVAQLVLLDHAATPTEREIRDAVEHARRHGARAVRTSALFPAAAEVVGAVGFGPVDRLALLSLELDDAPPPPVGPATRPMLLWHHRRAADIDREAFGPTWGNDVAGLRDVCRATPRHRARIVRRDGDLHGFAIAGTAGLQGYLQRLAVIPTHRRQGVARSLVTDAIRWMHTAGARAVLVNTGVDNTAALALYDGFGFRRRDDELTVMELRLANPGGS